MVGTAGGNEQDRAKRRQQEEIAQFIRCVRASLARSWPPAFEPISGGLSNVQRAVGGRGPAHETVQIECRALDDVGWVALR